MLGEAAVGGVEDEVVLVNARGRRFGAKFLERAKEGFGVVNGKLDFDFARHG